MLRITPSLVVLCAALMAPAAAMAADYTVDYGDDNSGGNGLRSAYTEDPSDWTGLGDQTDPIKFEFGLRYWYSMGTSSWSNFAGTFSSGDTSHVLEGHLRIEDNSTNTFATAIAGYSITSSGSYDDPFQSGTISEGHFGYAGADLGWNAWAAGNGSGVGPIVGYQYYNDQLLTSRAAYTTVQPGDTLSFDTTTGAVATPPMDSRPNNIEIHMLRLGASAKADMGFMDITGTVAAVPYSIVSGILGDDQVAATLTGLGNINQIKGSTTAISGWGYGATADVMLRAHPVKNMTIGIGGRLWYLQGSVDSSYDVVTIGDPTDSDPTTNPPNYDTPPDIKKQRFIEQGNPFSMMRYGLTAELSYAF